jgi:transcriptional regulator with XRE-family HTH domain
MNKRFRSGLGAWLRDHRESQRASQAELAGAVGLTPAAISHIECGRRLPTADKLVALARRLHVSLDELFLIKGAP